MVKNQLKIQPQKTPTSLSEWPKDASSVNKKCNWIFSTGNAVNIDRFLWKQTKQTPSLKEI